MLVYKKYRCYTKIPSLIPFDRIDEIKNEAIENLIDSIMSELYDFQSKYTDWFKNHRLSYDAIQFFDLAGSGNDTTQPSIFDGELPILMSFLERLKQSKTAALRQSTKAPYRQEHFVMTRISTVYGLMKFVIPHVSNNLPVQWRFAAKFEKISSFQARNIANIIGLIPSISVSSKQWEKERNLVNRQGSSML